MITSMVSAVDRPGRRRECDRADADAKGLTAEHCDRMLSLLLEHETRSIDRLRRGPARPTMCQIA